MKKRNNKEFIMSKYFKRLGTNKKTIFISLGIVFSVLMVVWLALVINTKENGNSNDYDNELQNELESFHVADGFEVTLFAEEPMVVKPIQMNWDALGRLWVVSSTIYPHLKSAEEANDKIYILEDTDGDGRADKSTIFADGLLMPTGILPGDGGAYVANSTEILHLSDTDGDGKADKRRVVLSGFGTGDTHHLIHTFRWGPASRLYFNQSIYIYSHVETPSGVKRLEGGGVWQLNPESLDLNIYVKGLINPWGLQFNRWGQSFLTDGAGSEGINYAFPGATFATSPGAERILRGLNPGQAKHCGLEILSGRHLPESWKGSLIAGDFRANRVNRFELEEQGSGYASKQVEDLLWSDNVTFRPVDMSMGPDGAIYVADWYNEIIQHGEKDFHDPRRDQEHGRIWRITAKDRPLVDDPNLSKASIYELLEALKLTEDWSRSHAKQLLKEKGASEVLPELKRWIKKLDQKNPDYEHYLLEALWVYQSFDVVNEELLVKLVNSKNHNARAAGIRALQFWHDDVTNVTELLSKTIDDEHPQVRLESVIALRKIGTAEAARLALSVLEYQMDEFQDFALWQIIRELEPFIMERLKSDQKFLGSTEKTVFALKSMSDPDAIAHLVRLYQRNEVPEQYQKDVLNSIAKWGQKDHMNILFDIALQDYGVQEKGVAAKLDALVEVARQRSMKPSKNLDEIRVFLKSDDEEIVLNAIRLSGYWGVEEMSDDLVRFIREKELNVKKIALDALAKLNAPRAENLMVDLATNKTNSFGLRVLATAQLVSLNTSKAAKLGVQLLKEWPKDKDAADFFKAYLSEKEGTKALAKELMKKKVPQDIAKAVRPAFERQIPWGKHKNEDIALLIKALEASGGNLPSERMPQQLNDQEIKSLVLDINRANGDPDEGEKIFKRINCVSCHAIGGAGGLLGPDLSSLGTSSPVETIIKSILEPSQSIKEGYELQRVVKTDGSVALGYLVSNKSSEIDIRDMSGKTISIAKENIGRLEKQSGSLMPAGLTASLEREEFVNLVSFLSKLGESGKFRVPNERFVRRWEIASDSKGLSEKINNEGLGYCVNESSNISFQPAYSRVSGNLPIEELPVVEISADKQYSFVRFDVEVLREGNINLWLNSEAGIKAWAGEIPLEIMNGAAVAELSIGIVPITLAIDRNIRREEGLSIKLMEPDNSPAQVRLVMGQ
tara:strand:+ start:10103 stop:13651 length:3549 start_codon:yes stop_codon:yes gene_type:complete